LIGDIPLQFYIYLLILHSIYNPFLYICMSARVLLNAFSPTTADKVTPKNKATGIAGRCVVHIYMFIFDPYPSSTSSSLLLLFDIFDNPAGLFLLFMFHVYHPIVPCITADSQIVRTFAMLCVAFVWADPQMTRKDLACFKVLLLL
jgi:hypothetical protein